MRARTGQGAVAMRMYPRSRRELIDGWSKGFAFGAPRTQPVLLLFIVVWMTGLVTKVFRLAFTGPRELWIVIYALMQCSLRAFPARWNLPFCHRFVPPIAAVFLLHRFRALRSTPARPRRGSLERQTHWCRLNFPPRRSCSEM